ncbi:gamma-glutamyltransferase [Spongiimicrobium salis]|uniref:gamma-glutamyltransferase n=1 Tax=Spongiimicrobium salis TaxID=1667022 RepID=UPI00374CE9FF
MKQLFLSTILGCVLLIFGACADEKKQGPPIGSVASAHPLATQAGMDILQQGGTAFDAAIAIAATLNVVEPMMSGLGGYGTILVYDAKEESVRFLNASGRFPAKSNADLMRAPTPNFMENRVGPKSISTPGNLNAWAMMHKDYGSLEWNTLFDHAIDHARNGFEISPNTAKWIAIAFEDFSPYTKEFYGKDGVPLEEGDLLVQTDLATTYDRIASSGTTDFYTGTLGKKIAAKMDAVESFLSMEDLKNNRAEWWDPLQYHYKGYDVYTASLPANSFPAFVNLGIMEQFASEELTHNSSDYLHLFAEMTKASYKARLAYSFDPEITEAPIDSILSKEALRAEAMAIDRNKASVFVPPFAAESKNTTHFVVVDQWGNTVSATQTLGNLFGSRVMPEGTGIWLNNSMAYATYEPKGNPMDVFPGRHKLSGDCPVIIMKDGALWAALGTPGGHTITQNVPQIIFNLIDFGMPMQQAIDAPKLVFAEPNRILVDTHMPRSQVKDLEAKGHQVVKRSIGNASGIRVVRDTEGKISSYDVGSDTRGEGKGAVVDH